MKLKIVKLSDVGSLGKLYGLVTEDGECLYTHVCSEDCFAYGDLYGHRDDRQLEIKNRFGNVEILTLMGRSINDKSELEENWHERTEH